MHINPLDFSGASLSLLSTYYFIRAKIIGWVFSILAIIIGIFLYYQKGIYGDMWLHVVYLISSLYGLWYWGFRGTEKKEQPIASLSWQHSAILALLTISCIISIHFLLKTYTHSQVPYLDATTTALSLTAQWLTCRKILQNWLVWFVVDSIYVLLYFHKGIPIHAVLYSGYLIIAWIGYYCWRHKMFSTNQDFSLTLFGRTFSINI